MVEYYGKFGERNFPQALLVGAGIYQSSIQIHFPILPKVKSKILNTNCTYTHDNREIIAKTQILTNFFEYVLITPSPTKLKKENL